MKKIKKLYLFVILCVLTMTCLLFGVACSKKSGSTSNSSEVTAIEITGVPTETVYYQDGGVMELDYKVTPEDAIITVEWKSSNTKVATVRSGRVSHKGVGTTTITATVKGTNISDSVEITLAEQPTLSVTVDGTVVEVNYRIDGKGVENAALNLDAEDTESKTIKLETKGGELINPLVTALFPTGEGLAKETLYEMTYTLTFAEGSYTTIPKMCAGLRNGTDDDWYHAAAWDAEDIVYDAPMNCRALFTTPSEQLDKVELFYINDKDAYNWKGGLTIADIEIKKVDASTIAHYIERKSDFSFLQFENDEEYGTETPEAKEIEVTSGLRHETIDGYFAHSGIRRVWTTSDATILECTNANDGKFAVKAKGEVTITSTIFGIEGVSDSLTITIDDAEPTPLKLQMKKNGETVDADIHLIEGANDFAYALTVSEDQTKLTVDTSVLGVDYRWFSLNLNLATGEELEDNTLYYLSYKVKLVDLNGEETAWFTMGATAGGGKYRIDYPLSDNLAVGNTYTVNGIFATGIQGTTEGYDNSRVLLYSNSNENVNLQSFKVEITDLVFEEAEESTSGQKGNTNLGNIYALIGWDHIGKKVGDTLTFAHNAPVFLPNHIFDTNWPEEIVATKCTEISYKWASSNTAVVNFTDTATGASEFLAAGDTTISLYAVLPDGGEYLLCARDIEVTAE